MRRIWLISADKIKASESVCKQSSQLELNSSLWQIIAALECSKKWPSAKNMFTKQMTSGGRRESKTADLETLLFTEVDLWILIRFSHHLYRCLIWASHGQKNKLGAFLSFPPKFASFCPIEAKVEWSKYFCRFLEEMRTR